MTESRLVPVLLVDDDDNDVVLFRRSLANSGASVRLIAVSSGEGALDYLCGEGPYADREQHPLPRLIFLDAHLPQVTGAHVLEFVKGNAELAPVPVIILTGAVSESDTMKLYHLGANAICLKPVSLPQTDAFVSCLCKFWIESVLPPPPPDSLPGRPSRANSQ